MTARSCASSTAKLARPTVVVSRSWFDSSSSTIAVDDSDRLAPRMIGFRRIPADIGDGAGQHCGGEQHLQAAEAEHQPPHGQQPMQRQFEADQKQQEDDAEFGDAVNVLGVADREPVQRRKRADQRAEAERAEQRAGAEIAEHRAEAEPADDRHHDTRRAEHDQRVAIGGNIDRRGHCSAPVSARRSLRRSAASGMHNAAGRQLPGHSPVNIATCH